MTETNDQWGKVVLFTAFEPSGDAHAAPVIHALREQAPSLRIVAWGGPRMKDAGATMLERSADDGSMGLGAISKIRAIRRHVASIRRWIQQYRVIAHVPVDSPAANFQICPYTKRAGAKVIQLVAPQLWAWGNWRTSKVRRLTDMILCLLPFEEGWFRERDIEARFIGHPAINRELDLAAMEPRVREFPHGTPKLAIFPGSRTQEVRANLRLLLRTFHQIKDRHSRMEAVIVAANEAIAQHIRTKIGKFPNGLGLITGEMDAVLAWCDLAVTVSGTMSMHVARHQKPMVGVYQTGLVSWLGSKVLLRTPYRLLPNIIAKRQICPEFVPHIGGSGPIVESLHELIDDSKKGAIQSEALRRVCLRFANKRPADEAARHILATCGLKPEQKTAAHT